MVVFVTEVDDKEVVWWWPCQKIIAIANGSRHWDDVHENFY